MNENNGRDAENEAVKGSVPVESRGFFSHGVEVHKHSIYAAD